MSTTIRPAHMGLFWTLAFAVHAGEPVQSPEIQKPIAVAEGGSKVTLDAQKRILVNGKPFFPIGAYNVPQDALAHARDLGFNTVHVYWGEGGAKSKGVITGYAEKLRSYAEETKKEQCYLPEGGPASVEDMRAYLTAAEKAGLMVWMGLPRYQILADAGMMREELETRIKALSSSPSLLMWYLWDEPNRATGARLEGLSALVRTLDPNHPTYIVFTHIYRLKESFDGNPEAFRRSNPIWPLLQIPDIIGTDHYATTSFFVKDEIPGQKLAGVSREIKNARAMLGDAKPVLNVVGAYRSDWKQLRHQVYQSIAAGSVGVLYYAYWDSRGYHCQPGKKRAEWLKAMNAELNQVAPILFSDQGPNAPITVEKEDAILSRSFSFKGKVYLLALNLKSSESVSLAASATQGRLEGEAQVMFEDRRVKIEGGRIREEIEANGVRCYELSIQP